MRLSVTEAAVNELPTGSQDLTCGEDTDRSGARQLTEVDGQKLRTMEHNA